MTLHPIPNRLRLVAPGGPVSAALASLREAESLPNEVLRFPVDDAPATVPNLRRALWRQLTADLARVERLIGCLDLLDRMEGDEDAEDGGDDEPTLGSLNATATSLSQAHWSAGSAEDGEDGDDTGLADTDSRSEQRRRFLATGGSFNRLSASR